MNVAQRAAQLRSDAWMRYFALVKLGLVDDA